MTGLFNFLGRQANPINGNAFSNVWQQSTLLTATTALVLGTAATGLALTAAFEPVSAGANYLISGTLPPIPDFLL